MKSYLGLLSLWNYNTENLNSTENPSNLWNFNTKEIYTENHTENLSLLFKYWSLHFANHTEKLLITLKKHCAVLQCNHVKNHSGLLKWISVLIIGKRLNTENALKYLWKNFQGYSIPLSWAISWIFRVTLKFSVWFSVLKFHNVCPHPWVYLTLLEREWQYIPQLCLSPSCLLYRNTQCRLKEDH